MICTEEEASKKWCPHWRGVVMELGGVAEATTNDMEYTDATCVGSYCMMWVPTDDGRGSCGLSRG